MQEIVLHIGMRRHLDAITLFHSSVAHDMVNMPVRVDDHQRLEAMAVDETEKAVLFSRIGTARVNDDALKRVVVKHVGVFGEEVEDKGFEFEHNNLFEPALRQAQGPVKIKVVELVETPTVFSRAKVRFFR